MSRTKVRHPILCEAYVTLDEIQTRLAVLYAKASRIIAYDESVIAGTPDFSLLDSKQQRIMELHRVPTDHPFPHFVKRTLLRTIDVLETKRRSLEAES